MASIYISPINNRIFIKIYNPSKNITNNLYTGYKADQPEAIERAHELIASLDEKLKTYNTVSFRPSF